MSAERLYSAEVSVTRCPGDGEVATARATVRYCDECRRWGANHTAHLCGRNWHARLSDLLIELGREGRQ